MADPTAGRVPVAHVLGTVGTGGVPVVAHALLRRLPDRWAPHLYYLTDRCADPARRDAQVAALRADGVTVRLVPADVARDKQAAADAVAAWVRADGVRVVHTHSTRPNRWGRAAALEAGARTVAHYHNHYDDRWTVGSPDLALERAMAPRTDALVACSRSVRDHLVERLDVAPGRVVVLPNGVAAERFRGGDGRRLRAALGVAPGVRVVGAVGRLCAQKAPDDVVRALAPRLRADAGGTVLWFVGAADDAELAGRVTALATALGVANRVRLLGFRSDMADVYAALDAVVLASRWEGFGLVVAEAMAAGRPVVATDVGGVGEAAGRGTPDGPAVRLVPPGDLPALGAAVGGLLDDDGAAADLAARGRRRADALGWDVAAARLDALYAGLLAADRPAVPA